jgi:hypothetical protein
VLIGLLPSPSKLTFTTDYDSLKVAMIDNYTTHIALRNSACQSNSSGLGHITNSDLNLSSGRDPGATTPDE